MAFDVFAAISSEFDPALKGVVTNTVSRAISANAGILSTALTLYVIVQGALTAYGLMSMPAFIAAAGRAAAVALLMTTAFFIPYIQEPFLTTIPNFLASAVGGNGTLPPTQFGQLWTATLHQMAAIDQQASGIFYIAERAEAGMIAMGIGCLLVICFFIWEIARWMMDVLICVGPFVLWLYLFRTTRDVPLRWLGKMTGILVLYVLVSVTVQVVLSADLAFMQQAQNAGGGAASQIGEQIAAFASIFVFCIFGTAMLIMTPLVASYIGGGVGVPTAQMSSVASRVGSGASAAASGVASGIRRLRGG